MGSSADQDSLFKKVCKWGEEQLPPDMLKNK
jgi:hypothetical protein